MFAWWMTTASRIFFSAAGNRRGFKTPMRSTSATELEAINIKSAKMCLGAQGERGLRVQHKLSRHRGLALERLRRSRHFQLRDRT